MQLNIYLYCICSHPTCFGPLLAHHQRCLGLLAYATIWLMQCCCMSMRSRTVALSYSNLKKKKSVCCCLAVVQKLPVPTTKTVHCCHIVKFDRCTWVFWRMWNIGSNFHVWLCGMWAAKVTTRNNCCCCCYYYYYYYYNYSIDFEKFSNLCPKPAVPLFQLQHYYSLSSSSICHGVGPLVDPFRSHVSRSLFKGLPWFLLPVGE
jgi:hypothetical protein